MKISNRLIHYFQNLRFRQKLIVSYLTVSIIPLIMLGAFSYMQANGLLLKQARQNLDNSVRQATESISYRTRQYEAIINSVTQNIVFKQIFNSTSGDFTGLYRDYVDPFFGNILDFNPDILQISVFTNRTELLRGEYILPLQLSEALPWARTAGQGEPDQTRWSANNGKFFATRTFTDTDNKRPEGQSAAILFLSLDGDSLFKGLEDVQASSYGVLIVNREGQPVLARNVGMEALPGQDGQLLPELTGSNGFLEYGQTEYMYVQGEIAETGWRVFYFTPRSGLSVDVRSIVKAAALIIGLCLVILLFIISLFSSTFVKRITHLNKTMMMVENGNLKVSVASSSTDEIGQLTNRFNRMLGNINTLIEEVYQSKIIQKEAELKALQTQINPHFLYNTLSIINWKALEIDAMEISRITTTVSKFYRTVLNKGKNVIAVSQELENANAYMQIQLIMHNNSFDFVCQVEEELLHYDMIHLIFQPLLENALEHGIDRLRKNTRRGRVSLAGHITGEGLLQFVIADNGPGMDAETVEELLAPHARGYGLKNVHDRIQILFGAAYGLVITSEPDQGTQVTVTFPKFLAGPGATPSL